MTAQEAAILAAQNTGKAPEAKAYANALDKIKTAATTVEELENLLLFGSKDGSAAAVNKLDSVLTVESFNAARQKVRSMTSGPIGPVRIHYTDIAVEWYRRPRSKKKRIRKKWRQRNSNWRPIKGGYIVRGVLYIHPVYRRELEAELRKPPEFPAGWKRKQP